MHCVVLGGLLKWLRDKESAAKQEPQVMWVLSQNWENPLEKEMATHSSVLAWRIPWTEEPGRLQSMRSQSWTQLSRWARKSFPFTFCLRCVPACLLGCRLSRLQLFVTLWTVAHQAPLSRGFSRQENWSGLLFPSPGDLPLPGIEPASLMSFTTCTTWEAFCSKKFHLNIRI